MKHYSKKIESSVNSRLTATGNHFQNKVCPKNRKIGRKGYILLILICLISFSMGTNAQLPVTPFSPTSKPHLLPIKGGEEGKNYAVIINTPLNRKDLIDKTTKFLAKWNLVNLEDVKLDEISDEQAEYTFAFEIPQSFAAIPTIMNAKMIFPPTILTGEIRFEFHDNGNVMIVFDNFTEKIFCTIDQDKTSFAHYNDEKKYPEMSDYYTNSSVSMAESSVLLKVLVVLNKGLDGLKEYTSNLDDYFNELESKMEIFRNVTKTGKGAWLSHEEYIQYAENTKIHAKDPSLSFTKQYFDERRLIATIQSRWESKIRPVMDQLFKAINLSLDGTIEGVAEEGEQTYINLDWTVLPVDPKWKDKTPPADPNEREKYIKSNIKKAY